MKNAVFILVFSLVFTSFTFCQEASLNNQRLQRVSNHYKKANIATIISGRSYNLKYLHAINSQFYNDTYPTNGSLTYEGVFFPAIEIQYDLYLQQVIVLHKSKNSSRYVSIDTEKVSNFSIGSCRFIHVKEDSIMATGIYEVAYTGADSDVLIKRLKSRKEKAIEGKNVLVFSQENTFYVKNQFGTFRITNKKTLLRAYQNSESIKTLIKKNKIKISKKKLEKGLITTVSLFDAKQ